MIDSVKNNLNIKNSKTNIAGELFMPFLFFFYMFSLLFFNTANAQVVEQDTNTNQNSQLSTNTKSVVITQSSTTKFNNNTAINNQIYLNAPISQEDIILYYTSSKDEEKNEKLNLLKKDFLNELQNIKNKYKESFYEILKEEKDFMTLYTVLEEKKDNLNTEISVKDIKEKIKVENKKPVKNNAIKNYSLNEKRSSSTNLILIPNVVLNDKTIYTEDSP